MMKIPQILLVIVIASFAFFPIPLPGQYGVYNSLTNTYWCSNEYSCLHEQGHQIDRAHKWISRTPAWSHAIYVYVVVNSKGDKVDPYLIRIMSSFLSYHSRLYYVFNNSDSELYADIYAIAGGSIDSIPLGLREFYK